METVVIPAKAGIQPIALFVCGTIAAAALTGVAFSYARDGSPIFLAMTGVAVAAYAGALACASKSARSPGALEPWTFWLVLALALAMRVPSLYPNTGTGSDIFRYVWDARLQRAGHNPYLVIPSDPAVAALHTADTRRMNNMDVPSPYPPVAQLFFRAVTAVSESPRAIKAALVAVDLVTIALLWRFLRASGQSEWLSITYAWHPLVALESARNGHLDALGALLLVAVALTLARGRSLVAMLAFVAAVAVKFLPIVLAPLLWRRVRRRDLAAGVLLIAALYWPYVWDGIVPIGSFSSVIDRYRFNGPLYQGVETLVGPWAAASLALLAGFGVALWLRRRLPVWAPEAWAWPVGMALACAPLVYPWYLVWLVPFSTTRATTPLLVWSAMIPAVYTVWARPPRTVWAVPTWLLLVEYGAVLGTGAWIAWRGARRAG